MKGGLTRPSGTDRSEVESSGSRDDSLAPERPHWREENTQVFLDFGRYFVPDRESQLDLLCDLVPPPSGECHLLDLGCGEGLLSQSILDRFPSARVHGLDGSTQMLERARAALAGYGDRFDAQAVELSSSAWRRFPWPIHGALSSLALHHLDDFQKRDLYADLYRLLAPGGILLVADLIRPASELGLQAAAKAWDEAVQRRSLELDGHLRAYERFQDLRWNYFTDPESDPADQPSRLLDQMSWLREIGFDSVDTFWMKAGHAIFGGVKPGP